MPLKHTLTYIESIVTGTVEGAFGVRAFCILVACVSAFFISLLLLSGSFSKRFEKKKVICTLIEFDQ